VIQYTKTGEKYIKLPLNYKMAIQYTKRPKYIPNGYTIDQHFPFPGPPKIYPKWDSWIPSGSLGFENRRKKLKHDSWTTKIDL
jgi:hypothetical protein